MGPSSGSVTVPSWSNPFASLAMGLEALFKGALFGVAGHGSGPLSAGFGQT